MKHLIFSVLSMMIIVTQCLAQTAASAPNLLNCFQLFFNKADKTYPALQSLEQLIEGSKDPIETECYMVHGKMLNKLLWPSKNRCKQIAGKTFDPFSTVEAIQREIEAEWPERLSCSKLYPDDYFNGIVPPLTGQIDSLNRLLSPLDMLRNESVNPQTKFDITLKLTAFQYGWHMEDTQLAPKSGKDTATCHFGPDIILPIGATVALQVTSNDIIHEAEVPELNIQFDGVPGRINGVEIDTSKIGAFSGRTSILSGREYSKMGFTISVVSRYDYEAWRNGHMKQSGCLDMK